MPRRLQPEEKALWGRVIETVKPLHHAPPPAGEASRPRRAAESHPEPKIASTIRAPLRHIPHSPTASANADKNTLDATWDRRFTKGAVVPDISVDLHETTLSGAYTRLDGALEQAVHQKMRVVLLVTGRPRAHDRASGSGRGAIAAVVRDWLAASRHAASISAVRKAHPRHGGDGALYIVLKR